jgi:hypothetical protein
MQIRIKKMQIEILQKIDAKQKAISQNHQYCSQTSQRSALRIILHELSLPSWRSLAPLARDYTSAAHSHATLRQS